MLARDEARCCGALQLHSGESDEARALARRAIEAFEGVDDVVVNAAGCGSAMKEYGHLLRDGPAGHAEAVVAAHPGCTLQIQAHARDLGRELPVLHPIELLARSLEVGRR